MPKTVPLKDSISRADAVVVTEEEPKGMLQAGGRKIGPNEVEISVFTL